jgi:hypothetical protein
MANNKLSMASTQSDGQGSLDHPTLGVQLSCPHGHTAATRLHQGSNPHPQILKNAKKILPLRLTSTVACRHVMAGQSPFGCREATAGGAQSQEVPPSPLGVVVVGRSRARLSRKRWWHLWGWHDEDELGEGGPGIARPRAMTWMHQWSK